MFQTGENEGGAVIQGEGQTGLIEDPGARRLGRGEAAGPGLRLVHAREGHRGQRLLALAAGRVGGLARREARRIEELQLRLAVAEDRPRDEAPACEPEHVSVARVAPRNPDAVVAGHRPDER
jgi:hypothetical protein